MNPQDALSPWSSPRIIRYLETNGEKSTELMTLASSFPEVAARVILCPIFSHRSFEQLSRSPALATFSSMSNHALEQLRRYRTVIEKGGSAFAPPDEVTFASTVTSVFLKDSMVDLGAALTPFFAENSDIKATELFLSVVSKRLEEAMQCVSCMENKNTNNTEAAKAVPPRRTVSLLSRRKTTHRRSALPQKHYMPSAMACITNVALGVSASERSELLKRLGDAPLPFQVRSIEEVKEQLIRQKSLEANTTVVLTERTSVMPPWKRSRVEKQSNEDFEDEVEKFSDTADDLTYIQAIPPVESSSQPDPSSNATWVNDGELVLVNGRLVHRAAPPAKELKARHPRSKSKVVNEAHVSLLAEADSEAMSFLPPPPPPPPPLPPPSGKEINKKRKSHQKDDVATESKRRKKKGATSCRDPSSPTTPNTRVSVVDTQSVPLKPKEELLALVEVLQISDVLRQAFLIGLTDDASAPPKGGEL